MIAFCNRAKDDEIERLTQEGYEPFGVDNDGTVYFHKRSDKKPATFEYTVLECLSHRDFVAQANLLGQRGWDLMDVEQPHGMWFGFFKRAGGEAEADPEVHDKTGDGVLATCGGL